MSKIKAPCEYYDTKPNIDICNRCGLNVWCKSRVNYFDEPFDAYDYDPADCVYCCHCGKAFHIGRVDIQELDDCFKLDLDTIYEFKPNYCPNCGIKLEE
jgi:hypothetical protein